MHPTDKRPNFSWHSRNYILPHSEWIFMLLIEIVFFIFSWWQHSENLASYEQQDAHEFFISMLDRIHEKLGKSSLANKGN